MRGVLGNRKYLDGLRTGYAIVRRGENVKRNIQPCSNRNILVLVLCPPVLCLLLYEYCICAWVCTYKLQQISMICTRTFNLRTAVYAKELHTALLIYVLL